MYLGTQAMAQSRSMPSWCDVRTRWARHKLRTTEEATRPLASPGPSGTRQLTNKPYPPVPLLPAFSYIPCQSIYLLSVFRRRPILSLSFLFSPASSVFAQSFRFPPWGPLRRLSLLSLFVSSWRLVGRAVWRVVSFCSSSRSCRLVGRRAVFVSSFSRVVSSLVVRPVRRLVRVLRF